MGITDDELRQELEKTRHAAEELRAMRWDEHNDAHDGEVAMPGGKGKGQGKSQGKHLPPSGGCLLPIVVVVLGFLAVGMTTGALLSM